MKHTNISKLSLYLMIGSVMGLSSCTKKYGEINTDRNAIAQLDHRTLRDLGLSESQARFEANKPFWRD